MNGTNGLAANRQARIIVLGHALLLAKKCPDAVH
jgi:hypothetical protein